MSDKFPGRTSKLPTDPADLTDLHLKALKPADNAYDRLVGDGLILRVMPSSNISFRFSYRHDGKQRVTSVGMYPKKNLAVLRAEYYLLKDQADNGKDVRQDKLKKKSAHRSAIAESKADKARKRNSMTIEGLADLFIMHIESGTNNRGRKYSPKTTKEYRAHLLNHIIPEFGPIAADELQRKEIATWLKKKAVKAPSQANHMMSTLSAMFSWSTDEEITEVNLVAGMKKPGGRQQSKTRALDYDSELQEVIDRGEIRAFWGGLDEINPLHRMALRLVLMTALRPGEVMSARWENILDDKWVIPVSQTKSKKSAHKVPLTQELKKMLKELRNITGKTPLLFPESRYADCVLTLLKNGRTGRYASLQTNTVSRILKKHLEIDDFSTHDLRRTTATHLKAMGYMDAEIGLLLHHISGGVTAVYARGDDMKRKLKMLNDWHQKLKQVLSDKQVNNVVTLR